MSDDKDVSREPVKFGFTLPSPVSGTSGLYAWPSHVIQAERSAPPQPPKEQERGEILLGSKKIEIDTKKGKEKVPVILIIKKKENKKPKYRIINSEDEDWARHLIDSLITVVDRNK